MSKRKEYCRIISARQICSAGNGLISCRQMQHLISTALPSYFKRPFCFALSGHLF